MSESDIPEYRKCINCGNYARSAAMIVGHFCSEECAKHYERCPHCGNYFLKDQETDQTFCSTDCQNADKIHIPGD